MCFDDLIHTRTRFTDSHLRFIETFQGYTHQDMDHKLSTVPLYYYHLKRAGSPNF